MEKKNVLILPTPIPSTFHVSVESNSFVLGFRISTLSDWLKKLAATLQLHRL